MSTTLGDVQREVLAELAKGSPTYLVGHAMDGDLK